MKKTKNQINNIQKNESDTDNTGMEESDDVE